MYLQIFISDEKDAAGRRQWEVSPDRVLQIARSYRSNERQDDASETTTVSGRRVHSRQGHGASQAFLNGAATDAAALDEKFRSKVLSDNDVASHLRAGHQALSARGLDRGHQERSPEAADQDRRGQTAGDIQDSKDTKKEEYGAQIFPERYPPSRYRPKTSLRLEGAQEYVTTSSDYFSAKHVDQAAAGVFEDARLKKASSSRGQAHRPKTSLWFEGKSHFSTTASDDFKAWEQTEAVTRHLRPRRFDDPIYDVEVAETEGDSKKRRTEADVAEAAESLVTSQEPHLEAREQHEKDLPHLSTQKIGIEDAARLEMQEYGVAPEDPTSRKKSTSTRKKPAGSRSTKEKRKSTNGTSMADMAGYFHPDVPIPFYPKDNLRMASGEMDLHTTNEMEYYKKKMERVRPVKPKSLSKLFGNSSGCSSADSDPRAAASRKGRRHWREKESHFIADADDRWQAAGLVSGHGETRTERDIDHVMQKRRFKGRRKPYFPEENLRLEGPTSYKTTNSEAYKNYDTRGTAAAPRRPQSHDVFQKYSATEDELRRIKNGDKSKTHISLFGRKDSTELIAEIQGLLSPQSKRKNEKRSKPGSEVFEKPVPVRPETSLRVVDGENGRDFTTTTSDAFKDRLGDSFQPRKPYYPKPNITSEGHMTFDTSNQNEYARKTVIEVPVPVRPVSTLKLSGDSSSYVVRNEDKIGYSKEVPSSVEARYPIRKTESSIVLGEDTIDYHTTSQAEYKKWEHEQRCYAERVEENYRKTKRDRFKTYTRPKGADPKSDKQHRPSGDVLTTTQAAFKPVTVERPQPFRPTSNLKIRNEQCSTEMSTTTRETFKKVTPTARVKPIKREPCLRKLGEDDDPMPKTTTSGEAYCEVKIPPKPEPYRPSDNLKVTGEMTFSTTTQEAFTSRSHRKNVEVVERTKPVKREAVVKDIIFPAPEAVSSPGSRGSGRKDDSAEVLRSVENVRERDSFTRFRKPSRDRPQTSQKVGEGEFHHVTSSMAEHQDRAAKHWKYSRVAELSGASTDECPAAFLNTDKSEYVFKEVIGEHRFYLPAVQ
ncbi:hypothetical protein HPB47_022919 [Ixodes persulcatus]|uniref:Uncharacterized protein n=1 Tax=Ixodes persulcatus TaxID=34615 RepID=A0AC60Q961_IXOPE|nr:hypothetical protein HPB47_022919 [Ixodes persulcatus]